jgi:hypothetical protein
MKRIQRAVNFSTAITLSGTEFVGDDGEKYTEYAADGERVLLSHTLQDLQKLQELGVKYNAIVIDRPRWGLNMSERWREVRKVLLSQLAETYFYTVVACHGYENAAEILSAKIGTESTRVKNRGFNFKSREEAEIFCMTNGFKIK